VPPKLTVHLNPEARAALGRVLAAERIKVAGSLLSPPNAQDIVRGLIMQAARGLEAEAALRQTVADINAVRDAYQQIHDQARQRVLDEQGIKNTSLTPDFSSVAPRVPQATIDRLNEESAQRSRASGRTCDADMATNRGTVSCLLAPGHAGEHRAAGDVSWQECGSTVTDYDGSSSRLETFTCRLPKGHPRRHEDAGMEWTDEDTRGPMQRAEELPQPMAGEPSPDFLRKPRLAPVSATVLLHDQCPHAVLDAEGVEHHCTLKPFHEGRHEDSVSGQAWVEHDGGGIVMGRISPTVGARYGNVLVHEDTPAHERIVVPTEGDSGRPVRRNLDTISLVAQANINRDPELVSAYLRANNGCERFLTWGEFVAYCRAQNSILETVPRKDGGS
jgi:hypothetical protein